MKMLNIIWDGDEPNLTEEEKEILKRELEELEEAISYDASNLITHTIFLESNLSGRTISVYGRQDDESNLFLEYHAETSWVTLDDLQA